MFKEVLRKTKAIFWTAVKYVALLVTFLKSTVCVVAQLVTVFLALRMIQERKDVWNTWTTDASKEIC